MLSFSIPKVTPLLKSPHPFIARMTNDILIKPQPSSLIKPSPCRHAHTCEECTRFCFSAALASVMAMMGLVLEFDQSGGKGGWASPPVVIDGPRQQLWKAYFNCGYVYAHLPSNSQSNNKRWVVFVFVFYYYWYTTIQGNVYPLASWAVLATITSNKRREIAIRRVISVLDMIWCISTIGQLRSFGMLIGAYLESPILGK